MKKFDFEKMGKTMWEPTEFEGALYYPIVDAQYEPETNNFMTMVISPDKINPETGDYIVFMAEWKPFDEWDREDPDLTAAADWDHAALIWELDDSTLLEISAEYWLSRLPTLD